MKLKCLLSFESRPMQGKSRKFLLVKFGFSRLSNPEFSSMIRNPKSSPWNLESKTVPLCGAIKASPASRGPFSLNTREKRSLLAGN